MYISSSIVSSNGIIITAHVIIIKSVTIISGRNIITISSTIMNIVLSSSG